MKLPIITEIHSLDKLKDIISKNEITIIKLGAKWCQPCKRIEPLVYNWVDRLPEQIQVCYIDIDISFNFYSFLKKNRIVNGVPALLCYYKKEAEINTFPDDVVIGSDPVQANLFFERCIKRVH